MTAEDAEGLDDITKRFVLRRRIGEGAFGVVWEAYDRDRHARVALKSLINADPGALYLFKREFRALADIVHPNLVTLYELLSTDERWFFTMELVDGVDFVSHVTHNLVSLGPPPLLSQRSSGVPVRVTPSVKRSSAPEGAASGEWYDEPTLLDAPNEEDDEDSDPTMQVRITPSPATAREERRARFDADRLRSALRQLAAGLMTLHEAGKLHRDIKPSNVLVTREGRVVILDFGLIAELSTSGEQKSQSSIVGTPVFMSPEQGLGGALTPASDWYAVGVMLYAALTGRVPFDGPPMHVLMSKTEVDAVPPGKLVQGLPPDLESLCVDLLRRSPSDRPLGPDVLQRLGADDARIEPAPQTAPMTSRAPLFVGRERHIKALHEAFERSRRGRLAAALVFGSSGMGKSSLIRYALDDVRAQHPRAVILTGRCYQRESVPYKALDSLIDELSVHLQGLPPGEAAQLMPRGVEALARLFPVLRQVEAVARPNAQATPIADPHELRTRAFFALRELLSRLAARAPLALFIDDLQWGDADSDALLAEIVRPPGPPPLLLIASYRMEELSAAYRASGAYSPHAVALRYPSSSAGSSGEALGTGARGGVLGATLPDGQALETPLSIALRPADARGEAHASVHEITVGELTLEESERLAAALLGPGAGDQAAAIAREAEGSPLFIDALVRHSMLEMEEARSSRRLSRTPRPPQSGPRATPAAAAGAATSTPIPASDPSIAPPRVNLAEMINARVARLPSGARRLLETAVIAGRPLEVTLARRAAGVDSHEQAVLSLLQVSHLIRARTGSNDIEIEAYHDRIRESVLASISPDDLKAYHNRLAITLELDGRADPELLATHYQAADRPSKASHYALKAADEAFDALAFDRAARLYRLSLSLSSRPDTATQTRLGESLANAGRGAEAADAYLSAAESGGRAEALDLRRRAAEQLLLSGHVDRGMAVVRAVLDSLGMKLAETPRGALASLLTRRTHLWLRGLRFKERSERDVPPEELMRIDTCWAVATGLSLVDNIRGADFQARHLLLALQAGEPYRIAKALAVEVVYSASSGEKSRSRTDELIRTTHDLATRIKHPHALALSTTVQGAALYLGGQWRKGLELLEQGASQLREHCSGVTWELDTADMFILSALNMLGRWKALAAHLRGVQDSSSARGDLYAAVHSRLDTGWIPIVAADKPDEARRALDEALARCSHQEGFQLQHGIHLLGMANVNLYCNTPLLAWDLFVKHWSDMRKAFMLEVPMVHMFALEVRARSAVASASLPKASPEEKRAWLKGATRDVSRMESERLPWATAMATLVRAGASTVAGDWSAARAHVTAAAAAFDAVDMGVHAALARRRGGELLGGDEGRAMIEDADQALSAQGIKAPARLSGMFAPGRWSA